MRCLLLPPPAPRHSANTASLVSAPPPPPPPALPPPTLPSAAPLAALLCSVLLMITSFVLDTLEDTMEINRSLKWIYRLLPAFCLGDGPWPRARTRTARGATLQARADAANKRATRTHAPRQTRTSTSTILARVVPVCRCQAWRSSASVRRD